MRKGDPRNGPAAGAGRRRLAKTLRIMAVAAAAGAFLAFVGAFGTGRMSFLTRTLFMILMAWAGAGLGFGAYRLAQRLPGLKDRRWAAAVVGGTLMFVPMGLVVWASVGVAIGRRLPVSEIPGFLSTSLVASVALTLLGVALGRRGEVQGEASPPAPPRFLDRLPPRLQGAEVWAVEAEDHYLRLHTSKGQDLILMRLADAMAELEGIEGAQTHRSWWVARAAIVETARGDGRATLTLKDGAQVPVSRTYAKALREKPWI